MSSENISFDKHNKVEKTKDKDDDTIDKIGVNNIQQDIIVNNEKEVKECNKESNFKNLFENMLYGFAVHKMIFNENGNPKDFIFLDINSAFTDITGLGKDVLGKRVLEVLPNIEKYWINKFGQAVKTNEIQKFEDYMQELNKIFSVTVFSPKKGYFATIIEDVTDFKKREVDYRNIFENSPIGIFKTTFQGELISYNTAFAKVFGFRDIEQMSRNVKYVYDLYGNKKDLQKTLELLSTKKRIKDKIFKITDMYNKLMMCKMNLIYYKDKILDKDMIEGTVVDITEDVKRKEMIKISDKGLKLIVDASDIASFDFNLETEKFNYSGYLFRHLGYTNNDIKYTKDYIFSLVHPEDELEFRKRMLNVYNNLDKDIMEYRIKSHNGDFFWVRITVQAVKRDNMGRALRIFGALRIINEDKSKQGRIKYYTEHDTLTELYNRNHFKNTMIKVTVNEPTGMIIYDFDGLKMLNDTYGFHAGDKALKTFSDTLRRIYSENSKIFRIGGDEFAVIIHNKDREYIEQRMDLLRTEIRKIDSIQGFSVSGGYSYCHNNEIMERLYREAEEAMFRRKLLKGKSFRSEMIKSLKATLNEKTHETEKHSSRIEQIAVKIGYKLNLDSKSLDDLRLMSVLHDIGKIGIPNTILNKPDKLTEEEWKIMKQHSEIGYRIAVNMRDLSGIAEGILYHHERWDGGGYPEGLGKEKIPLISRIIAVSDAYDAMTNDRAYRKAMSCEDALKEIEVNSGTQFDPVVVDAFFKTYKS